MNKTIIFAAVSVALTAPFAQAITGGETIVNDGGLINGTSCSAVAIEGHYAVSAGHCGDMTGKSVSVRGADGKDVYFKVEQTLFHPQFNSNVARYYDVAIWKLAETVQNPRQVSLREPAVNELFSIQTFGCRYTDGCATKSAKLRSLAAVNPAFSPDAFEGVYSPLDTDTTGYSMPGDSGGACVNSAGAVWGVIQGSGGQGDGTQLQSCSRLVVPETKDWITSTINSWSYPSYVGGDGNIEIKVQNITANIDSLAPWVEGALSIVSSNCDAVDSWGVCSVVVNGKGKLHLRQGYEVQVNPKDDGQGGGETGGGESGGQGGGGGGSVGWFGLILLAAASLLRKVKN